MGNLHDILIRVTETARSSLRKGWILLLVLLASNASFAQQNEACKEEVLQFLRTLGDTHIPGKKKKAFHLEYVCNVVTSDPNNRPNQRVAVEVFGNDKAFRLLSDEVRLYHDFEKNIIIQPKLKQVFITVIDEEYMNEMRPDILSSMQDSMFAHATVSLCHLTSTGTKQVRLEFDEVVQDAYDLARCDFWIDFASKKVLKIQIHYRKGHDLKYIMYEYKTMDLDYTSSFHQEDIEDFVFDKRGNPLPEYQNFLIRDLR